MKADIQISKRNLRMMKANARYRIIRLPVWRAGRAQPGHRIKRM